MNTIGSQDVTNGQSGHGQPWRDIFYSARDGLRLYARYYPRPPLADNSEPTNRRSWQNRAPRTPRPVICLPGFTRQSGDFHDLATLLSTTRDVYALDYRGRGRSQWDPDWRNYTPYFEMLDVLDFMALHEVNDAAVIGTLRGGIIAMIMGTLRPGCVGCVILNDTGPKLEVNGLVRVMGQAGRMPLPKDWDSALRLIRDMNRHDFPLVSEQVWREYVEQTYTDVNGRPAPNYDSALSRSLSLADIATSLPSMWPQFMSLSHVPVMVLRGENSDVLSEDTVRQMAGRHSALTAVTVPGQGHAPLLKDWDTVTAVAEFVRACDVTYRANERVQIVAHAHHAQASSQV